MNLQAAKYVPLVVNLKYYAILISGITRHANAFLFIIMAVR